AGAGKGKVHLIAAEDAQRLISEVLSESFGKLVVDTRIEGNLLRLK
ncbi:MAG: hypothetical protein IH787_06765, partial [Nitrospirae bacterium]|nr:hypothetical protein [Nitrospirota bacterium]